jgi:tetratricopeptide (TPR) repeat protein
VDVLLADGGHAPARLEVQLMSGMNDFPVAMDFTNSSGTVEFANLDAGQYHVKVSGKGIRTTDSGSIEVDDWNVFLSKAVVVQPNTDEAAQAGAPAVAAVDLNAPPKAIKEYNRGNEEMAKKHWDKAIEHFQSAINIYPQYSAAYNNLGASYAQLGQKDRQREALQKAIANNDHCVPALLNLAYLDLDQKQVAEAGGLLNKAIAADPVNVEALTLLAEVQVDQGQYEQAVEAAKKVHTLPHQHFAVVHYTAASALEREGRVKDAIAELNLYLQEQPTGARAEMVRKVLPDLEKEAQ